MPKQSLFCTFPSLKHYLSFLSSHSCLNISHLSTLLKTTITLQTYGMKFWLGQALYPSTVEKFFLNVTAALVILHILKLCSCEFSLPSSTRGNMHKVNFLFSSSSTAYSLCYRETRELCVCQPLERNSTGGFSLFSALSAKASSVCSVTGLHCQAEWSDPRWGNLERKVHLPLQTVKYSPAVFLRFIRQMGKGLRCKQHLRLIDGKLKE